MILSRFFAITRTGSSCAYTAAGSWSRVTRMAVGHGGTSAHWGRSLHDRRALVTIPPVGECRAAGDPKNRGRG